MLSGKNHLKAELAALAAIALAAAGGNALWEFANWQDQFQPLALIFVLAYLFSSLLLSPDLDLARAPTRITAGACYAIAGSLMPNFSATAASRTTCYLAR